MYYYIYPSSPESTIPAPTPYFSRSSMGSLSSLSDSPHAAQRNPRTTSLIYATFCPRHPSSSTTNISNWIECFNPSTNTWRRVTTIPLPRDNHVIKDFSMVSIGAAIYVIGGRLCRKAAGGRDPDDVLEEDHEVLSSVLRYDSEARSWSTCAALSTPRFDFACTVSGRRIYVAGGQCRLGSARGVSSAEVYDPALDEWKQLPEMSTLRYKCVGVTWLGKIHVVGGFAQSKDSGATVPYALERSSGEMYDAASEGGEWEFMVGMWQLDVPPNQIVAVNEKLFSSGDCLNAWKGHIEAYDAKLRIWNVVDGSHLETLSSPVSTSEENWLLPIDRLYLTMAPIGRELYFLAGYRMPGEVARMKSIVHVFDTSENGFGWRSLDPTEEDGEKELCSHCCVVAAALPDDCSLITDDHAIAAS